MAFNAIAPIAGDVQAIAVEIDRTWSYYGDWISNVGQGVKNLVPTFLSLDEGFDEHASVSWADSGDVLGRPESFKSYSGTSNREVTLTFHFRAQGFFGKLSEADELQILQQQVLDPALWLESLKYPVIASGDGLSHAPPPVILIIGSLLVMRSIAIAVDLKWVAPFEPTTMLPYGADVTVTFTAVTKKVGNFNTQSQFRLSPTFFNPQ